MSNILELRKRDEELIADWFKDHKATWQDFTFPCSHCQSGGSKQTIGKIIWARPHTGINRIEYFIHNNYLFVSGDLGDAVYEWPQVVDFKFLAGLNLDYFGGKCRASSEEPKGKTWSPDRVRAWIEEKLARWAEENPIPLVPTDGTDDIVKERPPLTFEQCCDEMRFEDNIYLEEAISSAGAWAQFLSESEGLIASDEKQKNSYHVWTPEVGKKVTEEMAYPRVSFEPCDEYDVGYTWDLRTRAHLIGLKTAWKQLNAFNKRPA